MADFLKSAFGMLGGPQLRCRNDFVGQVIELGNQKLRVKRLIAEGGFAFVFEAQDITHGKNYALKRLMVNDEEKNLAVMEEIKCVRKLSGHPNIVDFITAAFINHDRSEHGQSEYLLLTEFCSGGQLVDKLNVIKPPLPADLVLRIFYQVCRAVQHMHSQKVPIIHRDLKVENILLGDHGTIKLCDFGSATTKTHLPDPSWSAIQRSLVEDELSKNTTPMYRAPEMLDLYQNFPINEALDMWALGCILYLLCYKQHPFEDSAKLRILNGKYIIPESVVDYSIFHDMLMGMLRVNPVDRPTITDIVNRIHEIASAQGINLSEPLGLTSGTSRVTGSPDHPPHVKNLVQSHSSPSKNNHSYAEAGSPASALFSSIKGGAGSLVKNIRDASTKVMDTVSASMNRAELDISYITSRLAVMSYPAEGMESVIKNHIDDVRAFLESHHHDCYAVYNLTKRSYRVTKFENRVSECGWSQQRAPKLSNLFAICKNMHLWLSQNRHNVCIIHCLDGKANSATVVAAFLIFVKLVDSVASALHMFSTRRGFPCISPSQKRYVEYIWQMAADVPFIPHHQPVLISSITLSPVPLFNRMRNGCTPFVEVYMEEERIASTSLEYEKIK